MPTRPQRADTGVAGSLTCIDLQAHTTSRVAQKNGSINTLPERAAHVRVIVAVCRIQGLLWTIQRPRTGQGEHKTAAARASEAHNWQQGAPVRSVLCCPFAMASWPAHSHDMTAALGRSIRRRGRTLLVPMAGNMGERGKGSASAAAAAACTV